MSKKLKLNSGVEAYDIDNGTSNGAVLRVNFSDTNLYFRFIEMEKSLDEMEKEFKEKTADFKGEVDQKGFPLEAKQCENTKEDEKAKNSEKAKKMINIMREFDIKIKDKLAEVFGHDNDFDSIFAGVNSMSLDDKGNSIISNFLEMITPIIEQSAEIIKQSDNKAVKALVGNREQRRARNGK